MQTRESACDCCCCCSQRSHSSFTSCCSSSPPSLAHPASPPPATASLLLLLSRPLLSHYRLLQLLLQVSTSCHHAVLTCESTHSTEQLCADILWLGCCLLVRCVSPSLAFSAVVPSKNSDSDEALAWLQDLAASKEFNDDAGINAVVAAIQGVPQPLRPTGRVLYYAQPDELLELLPGVPLVTLVGIRLHWRAAIDGKPVSTPCLSRCGCCTPHSPNAHPLHTC